MDFPTKVMEVDSFKSKVDPLSNIPSIPDAELDKKVFSNNMYKGTTVSCINTSRLSATDASNFNACNLNTSGAYRVEGEDKVADGDTLATVTKGTSGISEHMAKMLGATIIPEPPVTPPVDPEDP